MDDKLLNQQNQDKDKHLKDVVRELHTSQEELRASEDKFKRLFQSCPDGIAINNPDGIFININKKYSEITGYNLDELKSLHYADLTPKKWHAFEQKQAEIVKEKGFHSYEKEYIRKDGSVFPVSVTAWAINNDKGEMVYWGGFFKDISKEKQAEKDLREGEERLRTITNSVPGTIYQFSFNKDGSFSIPYVSSRVNELLGFDLEQIQDVNFLFSRIHPDDNERVIHSLTEVNKDQSFWSAEFRALNNKNEYIWLRGQSFGLADSKGNIVHSGVFLNVTEEKIAKEKLIQSEARFRQLVETASDAIYLIDGNGIILDTNHLATQMLQKNKGEIINHPIDTVDPNFSCEAFIAFWKDIPFEEQMIFESTHITKSGKLIPVELSAKKFNVDDELLFYGIARDITERKRAEEVIRRKERDLRSLVENPAGYVIYRTRLIREKGKIEVVQISPSFTEVLGISEQDKNIFEKWFTYIHPDDLPAMMKANEEGMKPPFKLKIELRYLHPKKGLGWLDIRSNGIPFDDNPQLIEYANGMILDITERKNAEEALQSSEDFLNRTGEIARVGGWYLNENFDKVYWSQTTARIHEVPDDYVPSLEDAIKFYHPDDRAMVEEKVAAAINQKQAFNFEARLITAKGNEIWVNAIGQPEVKNNKCIRLSGTFQDISDRKKAEEELIKAKEKAEESDRLKTAFLANMSHEIRTPMNGILGFTNLLKNPDLDGDDKQRFIDIIEKSGKRMLSTIQDIIDISKIESGQEKLVLSNINLNTQLDELFEFFQPEAQSKHLHFSVSKPLPDFEVNLKTDKDKLNSILTNLIKNAIKYTLEGSIELGYHFTQKGKEQYFTIFVKDTGIGVPRERQKAIFNRFEQADIEDRQAFEGSGLGLAISKAYVEMLGGRIWVESGADVGSVFYFTLPHHMDRTPSRESKKENLAPMQSSEKKLKILIVEDDEYSINYLEIILDSYAKEMFIAKTGKEAIEIYSNNPDIDLILMDIKMPDMNGYEATRRIREFNNDCFIVAQTAYAQMRDKEKCLSAGCNSFISKPIKKEKLFGIIDEHFHFE